MSWVSWSDDGYGVPLLTGDNFGAVKKFLIDRQTNNTIIKDLREAEDEDDIEDILGDPLAWLIAGYIRQETGYQSFIGFTACGDTDFEAHIGFTTDFPWRFNKGKDSKLTLETAQKVLDKYIKELKIDAIPDYFTAEYCG